MSETMKAPGWAAIDAACQRLYARQVPHQYTSKTAYELETASPLPAITVWRASARPTGTTSPTASPSCSKRHLTTRTCPASASS
ncbi:hypothetical protein [Nannocystis pusilla]|uniref:hypothetical protein n=1 Tax=Nannocystis pusilla TaxID=889268 RepID=UPI003B7F7BD2